MANVYMQDHIVLGIEPALTRINNGTMRVRQKQPGTTPQQAHWDASYERFSASGVSWYQPYATLSVELAGMLGLPLDTPIIDVGGGASTFVDSLVDMGYSDVTVMDLSSSALELAKERLGPAAPVAWVHADLLSWVPTRSYGLWHDRAVFHFLTQEADKAVYLDKLGKAITRPGYTIMATFAPDGPDRCSGLPVLRYSVDELTELLSSVALEVVAGCRDEHVTPSGVVQPFTWVVARGS